MRTLIVACIMGFALATVPTVATAKMNADMDISFSDVAHLTTDIKLDFTETDAQDLRNGSDSDQDGTVSQEESDAIKTVLDAALKEGLGKDLFELDTKQADKVERKSSSLSGLTGPVSSSSPVTVKMKHEYTFQVDVSKTHKLVLKDKDDNDTSGGPEIGRVVMTLRAPAGYIIKDYTKDAKITLSADKKMLSGEMQGEQEDDTPGDSFVLFEKSGSSGFLPSVGFFGILAGLGLVAVALGRRT